MKHFPIRAAVIITAALTALQATAVQAGPDAPAGNTVAMEELTIAHESIALGPTQQNAAKARDRKAAPKASSSSDPEWKYVPVRRF